MKHSAKWSFKSRSVKVREGVKKLHLRNTIKSKFTNYSIRHKFQSKFPKTRESFASVIFFFPLPTCQHIFLGGRERRRERWGDKEGRGRAGRSWAGWWVVFLQGQIKGSLRPGSAVPTDPSPGHPLTHSKTLSSTRQWVGQTQGDGYQIHQIHGARVKYPQTHTPNRSGDEETKAQRWQVHRPGSQKQRLCISSLALPPQDVSRCYMFPNEIINKYPKCET